MIGMLYVNELQWKKCYFKRAIVLVRTFSTFKLKTLLRSCIPYAILMIGCSEIYYVPNDLTLHDRFLSNHTVLDLRQFWTSIRYASAFYFYNGFASKIIFCSLIQFFSFNLLYLFVYIPGFFDL